jgi:hypothetical protein
VSYAFRPLLGTGQATLLGASGKYSFGNRGYLASVWLWESRRSFARQPQIGDEPSRNLVGDVNLSLRFLPGWMTWLANALPFTRTKPAARSRYAEAALSMPNPNTENTAFVETWRARTPIASERRWALGGPARPGGNIGGHGESHPHRFYNPFNGSSAHLNPTLPERKPTMASRCSSSASTAKRAQPSGDELPCPARGGVMSAFPGNGLISRKRAR